MPATVERSLLLVEDDPHDTELFLLACREVALEPRVVAVPDAMTACNLLYEAEAAPSYPNSLPAAVIIDLRMPGMDGFDFLHAIRSREKLRPLPVIVLSSSEQPGDVFTSYQLGANAYVVKPVELTRFLAAVQILVRFWLLVNEPLT